MVDLSRELLQTARSAYAPALIAEVAFDLTQNGGRGKGCELRLVIEEAIRDFSPREREVIELRFVKGMTQIEIAKKLGISEPTTYRYLQQLRADKAEA